MQINDRKLRILKLIIDDFIDTAQPVGSRTIARKYPVGISSATIRNEMADLEELGYLLQPHTSAGRIPSEEGYRLYVDRLLSDGPIDKDQMELIKGLLRGNLIEVEDVVRQAAQLLTQLTGMVSLISLPQFKKSRLFNFKMVRILNAKVLMILVADSGQFKAIPIDFADVDQNELDRLSDLIRDRFFQRHIEEIDIRKMGALMVEYPEYRRVLEYLLPIVRETFREIDLLEYVVEGKDRIYAMQDFSARQKAQALSEALDQDKIVERLLGPVDVEGISVRIGSEIGLEAFGTCSIVTTPYRVNNAPAGKIAVLGPTRMDYGQAMSMVNYIRETLSELFSGIHL
jgi:heat-inducible transcriptional repressor